MMVMEHLWDYTLSKQSKLLGTDSREKLSLFGHSIGHCPLQQRDQIFLKVVTNVIKKDASKTFLLSSFYTLFFAAKFLWFYVDVQF